MTLGISQLKSYCDRDLRSRNIAKISHGDWFSVLGFPLSRDETIHLTNGAAIKNSRFGWDGYFFYDTRGPWQ
jgi:hypothetical protein